jgi:hypothetical protein
VHVSAPAGLGKTRLLNDVHGRLRAGGVRVVSLRANPGDRRIAYLLAGEIAGALGTLPGAAGISPAAASALVALHPGLSSNFAAPMDHSSGDEALRRRTIALSELVSAVADEGPLALLIDDVHWSDAASTRTLLGLLERLGSSRVLVVTSARSAREDLFAAAATDRLALEPLTVQQVGVLLASLGTFPAEDWTDSFVAALHATTGGSPLLVLETLQLALDRGSLKLVEGHWTCADPVFLITEFQAGGALRHRIAQLAPESRELLVLLATAGSPLPLARVARAAGQTAEETETRLGSLERRGFVTRSRNEWEPTHDQIAEIAVESSPLASLAAAHAALGRVLASDAEFDQRLYPRAAHHLAAAREHTELERLFSDWVELARARGDQRPATALAADLLGGDADQVRIRRLVHSLPIGRRTQVISWRGVVAASSLVLIAASVTISALGTPGGRPPPPDVELLALVPGTGDSVRVLRSMLDARSFGSAEPVTATGNSVRAFGPWSRIIGAPELSPDGRRWAFAVATGDTGVVDLFVAPGGEREVRLTYASGSDASPSWSPDAERVAFVTHRWSGSSDDGDIASMELLGRRVRRLSRGPGDDYSPRWSPDGTRIAFARRQDDPETRAVCWATADGTRESCLPTDYDIVSLLGWQGVSHVLAFADDGEAQVIVRIPVDGGPPDPVTRAPMSQVSASGNGLWIACLCQRPGDAAPGWYVFGTGSPQIARRIETAGDTSLVLVDWGKVPGRMRFVQEFAIQRPEQAITADATYRLRWAAHDSLGAPVPLPAPVLRWRSGNPRIAMVDSVRGVVRPRQTGQVAIHATAGGWRSDSILLTIAAPHARPLLREDWADASLPRWRAFGNPRPRTVEGPERVRGFLADGDGSFHSGAYSREAYPASGGLGVEARLSTPVTRPRLQVIELALTAALDSAGLARWDHRTGVAPGSRMEPLRSCSIAYPGGGGTASPGRFMINAAATTGRVPAPEREAPDAWYTVRLQIFPDGTCGVALDGVPVWRSDASLDASARYRIQLTGSSPGAPLLVGPLEVWDGVRGGVDWTLLE